MLWTRLRPDAVSLFRLKAPLDLRKTDLQDEETVVIQINPLAFQERCNLGEGARTVVDAVFGRVVAVCGTGHDELRIGHEEKVVLPGLIESAVA